MTIQQAIREVLALNGKVSNFDLELLVRQKVNCLAGTVHREKRKMSDVIKERKIVDGKNTNTYFYSLA